MKIRRTEQTHHTLKVCSTIAAWANEEASTRAKTKNTKRFILW